MSHAENFIMNRLAGIRKILDISDPISETAKLDAITLIARIEEGDVEKLVKFFCNHGCVPNLPLKGQHVKVSTMSGSEIFTRKVVNIESFQRGKNLLFEPPTQYNFIKMRGKDGQWFAGFPFFPVPTPVIVSILD